MGVLGGGRANPMQTIFTLFITAALFIFFQASILKNLQRSQQMLMNSGSEMHNKGKYTNHDRIVRAPHVNKNLNPKFAAKWKNIGIKVNGTLLRGVKKDDRKYYLPNPNGTFTCLSGNESIPWAFVNNDYCDCSDGSDEPGTSACKNGRFYCEPQLHFLSSSRVNDGICDCCDGSDEWKGVTIPPDLNLPETKDVRFAPCSDTCGDYEHQKLREQNTIIEGIAERKRFVEKGAPFADKGDFGPEGEFYLLSLECYTYRSPGYVYEICPYYNATQNSKDVWVIGKGGELKGDVENGFQLDMPGGASEHCPNGVGRKTEVEFLCSPSNEIKYVSEKEMCVYHVKFNTPAACPSHFKDKAR